VLLVGHIIQGLIDPRAKAKLRTIRQGQGVGQPRPDRQADAADLRPHHENENSHVNFTAETLKKGGEYSSMSVNDGDVVTLDVTVHHGALLGASTPITGTGNVSFLFWL
jgi:hypothetical protein